MLLKPKYNENNKFCVLRVHYSVDPDKNTPEWKAKAQEGISDRSWDREYEISYETFEGKPVYEGFTEGHIQEVEYKPGMYVYRGWDFGYHHPFTVFAFMNEFDQLCIRSEIMGSDEYIKPFGQRVKRFSLSHFPNAHWLDACDDAGKQRKDTPETSVQVLTDLGFSLNYRHSFIDEGVEIIRQRLQRRNDGKYGLLIHPDCQNLIDAFKGGYRYPEKKDGSPEKETPLKDGYYDHGMDALRELCVNFLELAPTKGLTAQQSSENNIMGNSSNSITGDSNQMTNDFSDFGLS